MNRIVSICLLIVTASSIAFGLYQKSRADKFESMAYQNEKLAQEMTDNAKKAQAQAEYQRKIAEEQMAIAFERAKAANEKADQMLMQSKKSK